MIKKLLIFFLIVTCLFLFSINSFCLNKKNTSCGINNGDRYPIMHPDRETFLKWLGQYNAAPKAKIDKNLKLVKGSLSLLNYLLYDAAERDQGKCGNCWAWAGTGCLEIALDVQSNIKNRLSVQYINSCDSGISRCEGNTLTEFARFYNSTKKSIPWSNTNASWQDGNWPESGPACSVISTSPNYQIDSISNASISTHGISQAAAIANIKNVLNQGKAVWFAFYLPDTSAWNDFYDFWDQNENTVYNIDKFSGQVEGSGFGGHAVLCVGYNDDDPNNSYWIMLNSWGTNSGRPNGLFRINMNMNYNGVFYSGGWYYSFYWECLNVQFHQERDIYLNSFSLSDKTSGSTEYTKEREVKVSTSVTGTPSQICFALISDCSGGTYYTYSSDMTYLLPEGDGRKTIYCRVKNPAGVESNILGASIYLDTSAPEVNFYLNNVSLKSGDFLNSQPSLKAVISELVGISESSIKFLHNGSQITDGQSGGGRYDSYDSSSKTVTYTFKNSLSEDVHTLGFEVQDLAGNTTTLNFTDLSLTNSLALEKVMNYPNPFNESTNFSYELSKDADVSIKIYDVRGMLVKTLTASAGSSGGRLGFNKIGWNGTDESGKNLANGMYIYFIKASDGGGGQVIKRSKIGISR